MKHTDSDTDRDENGQPMDKFSDILAVLDVEHLIRLRKRLQIHGKKKMVEILTVEIKEREKTERQRQHEEDKKMVAWVRERERLKAELEKAKEEQGPSEEPPK